MLSNFEVGKIFMSTDQESSLPDVRRRRLQELLARLAGEGLTQGAVARRANVPSQYLSDVKTGRRGMTELFARRLSDEFGVDYPWLLGQSDTIPGKRFVRGVSAAGPASVWLPVLSEPIEGDPQTDARWDGSSLELVGAPAAQAAAAREPYVLRLGADDRRGRLRRGDLLLISQRPENSAEIQVVRRAGKALLARRAARQGWEPVAAQRKLPATATVIGHALGILWGPL